MSSQEVYVSWPAMLMMVVDLPLTRVQQVLGMWAFLVYNKTDGDHLSEQAPSMEVTNNQWPISDIMVIICHCHYFPFWFCEYGRILIHHGIANVGHMTPSTAATTICVTRIHRESRSYAGEAPAFRMGNSGLGSHWGFEGLGVGGPNHYHQSWWKSSIIPLTLVNEYLGGNVMIWWQRAYSHHHCWLLGSNQWLADIAGL